MGSGCCRTDGTIAYHVKKDGGLDWYTYSGFKRYADAGAASSAMDQLGWGRPSGRSLSSR